MKTPLHIFKLLFLLTFITQFSVNTSKAAQVNEDSCWSSMLLMPDQFDPLLIHFTFAGTVPANSFQFLGIWDFGDGFVSTDSCPDHLYSQPGPYVVCLTFSICIGGGLSCHDETCVSMTIGNIAGIENSDGLLHSFYTYPNPVKSVFHIRTDTDKGQRVQVKDLTGRVVFNSIMHNDAPIDASAYSNGIYFIEVGEGDQTLKRKMIISR